MNHLLLQKGYFSLEKNKRFFIIKRFMLKAAAAARAGVPQHVSQTHPLILRTRGRSPISTTGKTHDVSPTRSQDILKKVKKL